MVSDAMVRNLAAQANAIWPLELPLFERYAVPAEPLIIDAGCGTGEGTARLAERFPTARIVGIEIEPANVERARARTAEFGERVRIDLGDALAIDAADGHYDLTVCRHVVHAVSDPPALLRELQRVTKPGGWMHVLAEDYGMIHFHGTRLATDRYWREGPIEFGFNTGTDLTIGRRIPAMMGALGVYDLAVDYLAIDSVRTSREKLLAIWHAWRDGYTDCIAEQTRLSRELVHDHWCDMITAIKDPASYMVWLVPVVSARR